MRSEIIDTNLKTGKCLRAPARLAALGTNDERIIAGPSAIKPRLKRRFYRCEHGTSAIEFAFIAPMLIALIIAVFEISLTFFAQQMLETTTEGAARQILTGQAQKNGMSQTAFKTMVCNKLPSFMSCGKLLVDVKSVTAFSAADMSIPTITFDSSGNPNNSLSYNIGNAGDIVVLRVMYIWPVVGGPLNFNISNVSAGQRLLVSTAVFKSEPYQ